MSIEQKPINSDEGALENQDENKAFRTILYEIGLKPEDFRGKKVLDLGSGPKTLEKGLSRAGVEADAISYDIDFTVFEENHHGKQMAVVGNAFQGLPFKNETFDLIINSGGPFRGNPATPADLKLFQEVLRVLKNDGEIRSSDYYTFRIPTIYAYNSAKEGEIELPRYDFRKFFGKDYEEVEFDEHGRPLPGKVLASIDFWNMVFRKFIPEDEKKEYFSRLPKNLEKNLAQQGIQIRAKLHGVEVGDEQYQTYLIFHKK